MGIMAKEIKITFSKIQSPENVQIIASLRGFLGGTSGKEPACQCRRLKRLRFNPWVRKVALRKTWQPTPVFLPGESHGQRNLAGYSP